MSDDDIQVSNMTIHFLPIPIFPLLLCLRVYRQLVRPVIEILERNQIVNHISSAIFFKYCHHHIVIHHMNIRIVAISINTGLCSKRRLIHVPIPDKNLVQIGTTLRIRQIL